MVAFDLKALGYVHVQDLLIVDALDLQVIGEPSILTNLVEVNSHPQHTHPITWLRLATRVRLLARKEEDLVNLILSSWSAACKDADRYKTSPAHTHI